MLDDTKVRMAVPVTVGTVIVGSLCLPSVLAGEEAGYRPRLVGAGFLQSPYRMLALAGIRTQVIAWLMLLGLLVADTVYWTVRRRLELHRRAGLSLADPRPVGACSGCSQPQG